MVATIGDLQTVMTNIIRYALGLTAIAFFILLLLGGFRFITSGGDPKSVDAAKKTLTYAVSGLVLILLSYLILVFIQTVTGVNVTQFQIVQ